MPTPTIEWVDRYPLHGVTGKFAVFTSKHSDGSFHGAVWYYTKSGSWTKDQDVELNADVHFEIGDSLDAVLDACLAWSRTKFGKEVSLGARERLRPNP
ncbi:MAG: hypothetical protein ACREJD_08470 [Phycisphaerales bacterium]